MPVYTGAIYFTLNYQLWKPMLSIIKKAEVPFGISAIKFMGYTSLYICNWFMPGNEGFHQQPCCEIRQRTNCKHDSVRN